MIKIPLCMGMVMLLTSLALCQPPVMPLKEIRVTSPYGYRMHPLTGKRAFHKGVDLGADNDTVYCIYAGTVQQTGYHPKLGRFIRVSHGNGLSSLYGHLAAIGVDNGQLLHSGQPLAISGNTGRATGEHLHFEVEYNGRSLDPLVFMYRIITAYEEGTATESVGL